jgi:hypothetical protein
MTGGRKVGRGAGLAVVALAALLGTAPAAQADDDRRAMRRPLLPLPPQYQQECAACHIAYPPGLLPAASWRHLMSGLAQHFGTDAALDAASTQAIAGWLAANAADAADAGTRTPQRPAAPPPNVRITRSAWFVREHDEVSAAVWKRPSVKSPANCQACHRQADQGDFNERSIRIPR